MMPLLKHDDLDASSEYSNKQPETDHIISSAEPPVVQEATCSATRTLEISPPGDETQIQSYGVQTQPAVDYVTETGKITPVPDGCENSEVVVVISEAQPIEKRNLSLEALFQVYIQMMDIYSLQRKNN